MHCFIFLLRQILFVLHQSSVVPSVQWPSGPSPWQATQVLQRSESMIVSLLAFFIFLKRGLLYASDWLQQFSKPPASTT